MRVGKCTDKYLRNKWWKFVISYLMKNLRSISDFMKPERISFSIFISWECILLVWVLVWILSPPNRVSSSESPILSNSISVSTWSCIALLCTRGDWFTLSLELWVCSLSLDNGTIVLTTTRFYRHWCTLISVKIFHKPFLFNVLHFATLDRGGGRCCRNIITTAWLIVI